MMNGMFNMPQPPQQPQQGQTKINPYIEAAKKNPLLKFPGTAPFNQNDPAWKEYMKWEQATHAGGPPDASKIATILGIVHKARGMQPKPGDRSFTGPTQQRLAVPPAGSSIVEGDNTWQNTPPGAGVPSSFGPPTMQGQIVAGQPLALAPEPQTQPAGFAGGLTEVTPGVEPVPAESALDKILREMKGEKTKAAFRSLVKEPERKQYHGDKKKQLLIMLLGGLASYLGGGTDRAESVNAFARTYGQGIQQDEAQGQLRFDKEYEDAVNKQRQKEVLANQSRDDLMRMAQLEMQNEQAKENARIREQGLRDTKDWRDDQAKIAAGKTLNGRAQVWINMADAARKGMDPKKWAELLDRAQKEFVPNIGDLDPINATNFTMLQNELTEKQRALGLKNTNLENDAKKAEAALKLMGIAADRNALKLKFETETFDEDLLIKAAKVAKAQADAGKAKADVSSVGRVYSRYARHPRAVANDMSLVEGGKGNFKELKDAATRAGSLAEQARMAMAMAEANVPTPGSPTYDTSRAEYEAAKQQYKDLMEHAARAAAEMMRRTLGPTESQKGAKSAARAAILGASAGSKINAKIPKKK